MEFFWTPYFSQEKNFAPLILCIKTLGRLAKLVPCPRPVSECCYPRSHLLPRPRSNGHCGTGVYPLLIVGQGNGVLCLSSITKGNGGKKGIEVTKLTSSDLLQEPKWDDCDWTLWLRIVTVSIWKGCSSACLSLSINFILSISMEHPNVFQFHEEFCYSTWILGRGRKNILVPASVQFFNEDFLQLLRRADDQTDELGRIG